MPRVDVGRKFQSQTRVEEWMTADKAGNAGVDVLSTPNLLQLIEQASIACLAGSVGSDEVSLGSYLDLNHLAPSPVGLIVRVEVEIIGVEGRRVDFAFAAFDEREKIAEGVHERYIIERARFRQSLEEKLS